MPKGSFYYYFASKEAFGCALLQDYVDDYLRRVDALAQEPGSAGDKLMRFWSAWLDGDEAGGIAERCLVVKLGAEVSDLSEEMRRILDDGRRATGRPAGAIASWTARRTVRSGRRRSPRSRPRLLYAQWLGAAILARLSADRTPLADSLEDMRRLLP